MIGICKRSIETAHATKARGHGYFSNRQMGFGKQLLGEQQALRGVNGNRWGAQVLDK